MDILCAEVELHLPECASLKDKRTVVKATKERLRERFGVSVAEIDYHDLWQRTLLGIALVSPDHRSGHVVFAKIRDFLQADPRIWVVRFQEEWR